MTQKEQIIDSFRRAGGRMNLAQILAQPWGYEFRARATEMRKSGFKFIFTRGRTPSENIYEMWEPVGNFKMEGDGQLVFA
jgi:hypothetical protein